jgi:hypothetical protein
MGIINSSRSNSPGETGFPAFRDKFLIEAGLDLELLSAISISLSF